AWSRLARRASSPAAPPSAFTGFERHGPEAELGTRLRPRARRRKAVEVLDREQRVDALLEFEGLRRGFTESVVDQRQHSAEDADGSLADISGIIGAAIVAAEPDLARQRRDLQPPPQFV